VLKQAKVANQVNIDLLGPDLRIGIPQRFRMALNCLLGFKQQSPIVLVRSLG
jgi:hypothetical protein